MNKFVPRERLASKLKSLKKSGKTIVFANGCFDLMHVGHLRYLEGAKKAGGKKSILVVALNTDNSVSKIKGPARPVMNLKERAEMISALACVDFVTSFGEPSAEKTLLTLRPHIQAKGTDYTKSNVPEAALMKSIGGRIAITGDPKNHSTTDLIKKVKKAFR